ncbi:MAG: glycoside hydrolase family 3 protein [Bacteroidota bacterium]|nr:glycoside hydrolase family 3 protein [Bacteroidota bacterium]
MSDSLDYKIAQMLLIGFRGMSLQSDDSLVRDIKAGRVGGIILFDYDALTKEYKRNIESPEQVRALTKQLAQTVQDNGVGLPLLISIDQEGGRVSRLKSRYGFPVSVSQQYLGSVNNLDTTRWYAAKTAQTLAEYGFNLNFAPLVDLNRNPENPVIGKVERSFSADPDIVSKHAAVVVEEHRKRGIITTLKHFPGHGSSTADSHKGFVDVSTTWKSDELQPYAELIRQNKVDMIMTAHIFNKFLDSTLPATLSKRIITGILRDSLGYKGVIISDDMQMGAIAQYYGLETALEECINAGVDIICFGNNLQYDVGVVGKATAIIKRLVAEGKVSRERIDESYRRIVQLKQRIK